jgi:hypothetical protein
VHACARGSVRLPLTRSCLPWLRAGKCTSSIGPLAFPPEQGDSGYDAAHSRSEEVPPHGAQDGDDGEGFDTPDIMVKEPESAAGSHAPPVSPSEASAAPKRTSPAAGATPSAPTATATPLGDGTAASGGWLASIFQWQTLLMVLNAGLLWYLAHRVYSLPHPEQAPSRPAVQAA